MDEEYIATRDDIDNSDDPKALVEWWDIADDVSERIKATIEAREIADISQDEWFFRASDKYSYCQVAKKRIERKLFRIDKSVKLTPHYPKAADINDIRNELFKLKRRLYDAGIP